MNHSIIYYSKEINYNAGFGIEEINLSLEIVGDNWWLERSEYDGSEGWDYKEMSKKPDIKLDKTKAALLGVNLIDHIKIN